MLLVPEMDQPTPATPLPFRLLYVSATSGCIPARPGGTLMGIRYVAAPPSVDGAPGIVPTHPCGGIGTLGGVTGASGRADNQVSTTTLVFCADAYALQPDGLHARTR